MDTNMKFFYSNCLIDQSIKISFGMLTRISLFDITKLTKEMEQFLEGKTLNGI